MLQDEQYLSADSVWCPQRHRESLTVATDVVSVVEDGVFGAEEDSRSTMRQVLVIWEGRSTEGHSRRETGVWQDLAL